MVNINRRISHSNIRDNTISMLDIIMNIFINTASIRITIITNIMMIHITNNRSATGDVGDDIADDDDALCDDSHDYCDGDVDGVVFNILLLTACSYMSWSCLDCSPTGSLSFCCSSIISSTSA